MAQETARDAAIAALTAPGAAFETVEAAVGGIPMRVFAGGPPTLRAVLELSRGFGDRDFLVYEDQRWSFAGHFAAAAGLSRLLAAAYGLAKGDRVAIAMRNYPEWALAFWAAEAIGAIVVPLNAWWSGPELAFAIRDAGVRLVVADRERVRALRPHLPDLDLTAVIAVRDDDPGPGVERWDDVCADLDRDGGLPGVEVHPDDDATILYTSGTTGRPKGAIGSHRNHCTNLMNTALSAQANLLVASGGAPQEPGGEEQLPGVLQTFPLFHIAGLTGLYCATALGSKLALMYRWDRDRAVELVRRERLTSTAGVPTVMRDFLEALAAGTAPVPTLSAISLGGAPIPAEMIRRIDTQFSSAVRPGDGYGLTETTSAVVINSGADYVAHPDSVGRAVPGADIRVVEPGGGADVAEGRVGELWFRGPNVVRGYWNDPQATAEAFTDGWFHTGDLGYVRDGWVYVVDRIKDVVIRGGENVYCAEVEAALFEHAAVADAAVIGLPHPSLGEEVTAVVNLRMGRTVTVAELRAHLADRLASFKVPTRVIFWAEPLPRTATGKVLKRDLRRRAAALETGEPRRAGR